MKAYVELIMPFKEDSSLDSKHPKQLPPSTTNLKSSSMLLEEEPIVRDKVIIVMQQLLVMHRDCLIRNIALPNIQSSSISENNPGGTKEGANKWR